MTRHRYPWEPSEEAILLIAKRSVPKVSHKLIARALSRSPRSIDQHVARLRERGVL